MGKKDERVDAYIERAQPFARPILRHLRKIVHEGCPEVEETMKWSFPHFMYKGMLCSMAAFKQHCAFGFWKGSLIEGAPGLGREAMGQFGRIAALDDLPDARKLVKLVRQAATLNDEGVKAPKVRKPELPRRPVPRPPAAFLAALRKNEKALATYQAFSPSHKREYVEWIVEAKSDATREHRMMTAIEWMAEGKARNWKYERSLTRTAAPTSARPSTRGAPERSRR
jgi:hypothetical protein